MSLELCSAAVNGNLNLVISAIKKGANVDGAQEGNNHPPLNLASKKGHLKVVEALINHNANINKMDNCGYGYTPLHQACKKGHFEIAKLVIEKGANINATDCNGQTPLHLACKKNYIDIASLLIENNADVNIADQYKVLPLLLAVGYKREKIIHLLQKNGAEIFGPNDNGEIWDYLVRKSHIDSLKLIIDALLLKNPEEKKPDVIQQHEELSTYWDEYKVKLNLEILALKKVTFGRISLFDFYLGNINKLAAMSRNEEIQNIITNTDFIVKYPNFGNKIKENFEKGLEKDSITDQIIKNLYPIEQQLSWLTKFINWIASFFLKKKEETKNIRLVEVEDVDRMILGYLDTNDLKSFKEAINNSPINNASGISFFQKSRTQNNSISENVLVSSYPQRP